MNVDARMLACACGLAACLTAGLSACSSSSAPSEPSASSLQSSVRSAVSTANSVHVSGQLSDNGIPVQANMGVHRTGDVSGSLSQNGASLSVTGVDGKFYVKATPEFLREVKAPANACPVICGKWLPLPPQTVSQIASQLNLHNLTGALDSITTGKVSEVGSTTVNGKTAWVLKGANGVTVDVSTASPHYPLRAHAGNGKSGVVTFTQWNSVPKPTAPPASQIVNLNGQHT